MARRLALGAEVVARLYQTDAEELLPQAVHLHASGERMLLAHEPLGEVEAGVAILFRQRWKNGRCAVGYLVFGFVILAAFHDEALTRLRKIGHDEGGGDEILQRLLFGLQRQLFGPHAIDEFTSALALVFKPPFLQALHLCFRPFGGFFAAHERLQIIRQSFDAATLVLLDPHLPRPLRIFGGIDPGTHREVIPIHRASKLSEGITSDFDAWFEAELIGGDFELHPLAGFRQHAHTHSLRGAHLAKGDRTFLAPHGAVIPACGVKLKHDSLRWALRVEVALHADFAVRRDLVAAACGEEILRHAGGSAFQGLGAAEDLTFLFRDKFRRLASHAEIGSGGKSILEPYRLTRLHGRRRRERGGIGVVEFGDGFAELGLRGGDVFVVAGELLRLLGCAQTKGRRREEDIPIHRRIGGAVEEGIQRIKFLLRDGIKLVIVTHGAACGQAHPHGHRGIRAVHGVAIDELLIDAAAFAGGDVAAIEARGDLLILRGIRQEIAGELPDGELIKREVLIEGTHHPIAVRPHAALVIEMQAMRIGIAGHIQPVAAHVLAVAFGFQKAIHEAIVGLLGCVSEKRVNLFGCGR